MCIMFCKAKFLTLSIGLFKWCVQSYGSNHLPKNVFDILAESRKVAKYQSSTSNFARDWLSSDFAKEKIFWKWTYISIILLAPSKAPSSMFEIWFRLKSTLSKFGSRLNNPKAGIEVIWLSFNSSLFVVFGKSIGISEK